MTLFDRIQNLAKRRGKSIKEVATDMGFNENQLYTWKRVKPSGENLAKVADYFHVTVDYLLGRNNNNSDEEQQSPEFYAIQRKAMNMSPDQQKRALEILNLAFDKLDKGELTTHDTNDF